MGNVIFLGFCIDIYMFVLSVSYKSMEWGMKDAAINARIESELKVDA